MRSLGTLAFYIVYGIITPAVFFAISTFRLNSTHKPN